MFLKPGWTDGKFFRLELFNFAVLGNGLRPAQGGATVMFLWGSHPALTAHDMNGRCRQMAYTLQRSLSAHSRHLGLVLQRHQQPP